MGSSPEPTERHLRFRPARLRARWPECVCPGQVGRPRAAGRASVPPPELILDAAAQSRPDPMRERALSPSKAKAPAASGAFAHLGQVAMNAARPDETPRVCNAFLDARLIKIQRLPWYLQMRETIFWQQQTSPGTYIAAALWQRKAATVSPQRHAIQLAYAIQHVRHYKS
jgi:hypothetical protein